MRQLLRLAALWMLLLGHSCAVLAQPAAGTCRDDPQADTFLRSELAQRQLVASGLLRGEIGNIDIRALRQALCNLRLVNGRPERGPVTEADKETLTENLRRFEAWSRLEPTQMLFRDRAEEQPHWPIRLLIPAALTTVRKEQPGPMLEPSFTTPSEDVVINVYSYPLWRNPPHLFLATVLRGRNSFKVRSVSIERGGFHIDGLDRRPQPVATASPAGGPSQVERVVAFHRHMFTDSGRLKGFGLIFNVDAPADPQRAPPSHFLAVVRHQAKVDPETRRWLPSGDFDEASRAWQLAWQTVAYVMRNDFEGRNGMIAVETRGCSQNLPRADDSASYVRRRVVFGTNRDAPLELPKGFVSDPTQLYGLNASDRLRIGCAIVSVPRQLASNRLLNMEVLAQQPGGSSPQPTDAMRAKSFYVERIIELDAGGADGKGGPARRLGRENIEIHDNDPSAESVRALVFIHGYNVPFHQGLARAAQIAQAAGYQGRVYLYSWPSINSTFSYLQDMDNAEQSQVYFRTFLRAVMSDRRIRRMDFVAHSMGSQPLLRALNELKEEFVAAEPPPGSDQGSEVTRRLGQVIFASPDVSSIVFAQEVQGLLPYANRITVYMSRSDWAMYFSRWFRGKVPRVGDFEAVEKGFLRPLEGIGNQIGGVLHLIDTSQQLAWYNPERYKLNHSDFADRDSVVNDIAMMLKARLSEERITPGERNPKRFKRVPEDPSLPASHWMLDEN